MKEELFAAFFAGFEHSGEGFNGEHVSSRHFPTTEALKEYLREKFDRWVETGEVPA